MNQIEGQICLFDFLKEQENKEKINHILSVGDKVGRVVLGECRIATVTEIEGLPLYPFYRTDSGCCYSVEDGLKSIEELVTVAETERAKYKTIIPENLQERITVEYKSRECDGVILWAQIGIINNMLFWKEDYTYQFLVPCDSKEKLMKEYEKHKKSIMEREGKIVDYEKTMRRLYWSKHGFYADAEYVEFNG